jgi:hypothetical protein
VNEQAKKRSGAKKWLGSGAYDDRDSEVDDRRRWDDEESHESSRITDTTIRLQASVNNPTPHLDSLAGIHDHLYSCDSFYSWFFLICELLWL